MKTQTSESSALRMQSLTDYLWPAIRLSVTNIFIGWFAISVVCYFLFSYWTKSANLQMKLHSANSIISEAIDIGDWDFALQALKANATASNVYNLTLFSKDEKSVFAGPLGSRSAYSIGALCLSDRQGTTLTACTAILSSADVLNFIFFMLATIIITLISALNFRSRAYGLFNRISSDLTDGLLGQASDIAEIRDVQVRLKALISEKELSSNQKALADMAMQVAHDIRSPLGALQIAASKFKDLDSDRAELIFLATKRINDIAHMLLSRHRMDLPSEEKESFEIKSLVGDLVAEKKFVLSNSGKVQIELKNLADSPIYAVGMLRCDLASALSNIVNNSIDALEGRVDGRIGISISDSGRYAQIAVEDNGSGMSEDLIEKLGNRGVSFGKVEGNGLGFYQARKAIEEAGGLVHIDSSFGRGTMVIFEIPKLQNA